MGAVSFSLDNRLVDTLLECLPLTMFVETGTFRGDTVAEMKERFDRILSIELSRELFQDAATRFAGAPGVEIAHGSSPAELSLRADQLRSAATLYWLDAHWCEATDTAGATSQCPLLDEVRAIGSLNASSVILIDDARLFLAPPPAPHEISQWPSFDQVVRVLRAASADHQIMVVNDVIAFYPPAAAGAMKAYAQQFGLDWLHAAQALERGSRWLEDLEKKEAVIGQLTKELESAANPSGDAAREFRRALVEKETVIREQALALDAYRRAYGSLFVLGPIARVFRRIAEIFRPRIGNLNQYRPRPLRTSSDFKRPPLKHYPKISIVTPSFRQGNFIERTICSVLDQQYPELEYFVQDGGSLDGTVRVLEKYQTRLTGWVSEPDQGQSDAINRGMAKTSGTIMAWLNSDDLLLPGTLHCVAEYFEQHPDVDVVYGNRLLIDDAGMEIGRWILPGHDDAVLAWADYVPQETLFWRRSIWEKIGAKVDESYRFAMDWDLLIRFREAGANMAHIPRFLGAFRIHELQKTSAVINVIGQEEMNRIRARLIGRVPSRDEIRLRTLGFLLRHVLTDLAFRIRTRLGKQS